MMNDRRVHHSRMRCDNGGDSHYAWMRIDLAGGSNGNEDKELWKELSQCRLQNPCASYIILTTLNILIELCGIETEMVARLICDL